jgi:peptidoglycan/xylan/chitin deacetylase (PgdA/CDA1 family)
LGISRTLVIDNTSHPRLGAQQYGETLPLADREVVLTFDDGPLGPYTTRILDLLAAECVKATYFLVGTMAKNAPDLVRRIQREGHTIGTHSLSHPLTFDRMPLANAEWEIDGGIAAVKAALGDQGQLAPFFRIPGLLRSSPVESYLASRSLVTWSVDLVADDWHRHITANDIAQRALRRLDARGRGILLLHDIHPATALAMPAILRGLKERGFRVVHVVPAAAGRPKTYSEPQQWAAYSSRYARSRIADVEAGSIDPRLPVPSRDSLGMDHAAGARSIAAYTPKPDTKHVLAAAGAELRLPAGLWPREESESAIVAEHMAPAAPGLDAIDWPRIERITSLVSSADAVWPVAKPVRVAEPPHKKTKTAARNKSGRTAAVTCKGSDKSAGPRCKKPVGHQLSLNGDVSPARLRSQYSF